MAIGKRKKTAAKKSPPRKTPPKKTQRPPRAASDLLTRRELAASMSIGRSAPLHLMTITKWEQNGMPIAERGGPGRPSRYRQADVEAWLNAREESSQKTGVVDVARERARKELAQAKLAEQLLLTRGAELLERQDVERVWSGEIAAVRTKLLGWSQLISDRVHRAGTLEGIGGVERELQKAVEEVLRELANPERFQVDGAA